MTLIDRLISRVNNWLLSGGHTCFTKSVVYIGIKCTQNHNKRKTLTQTVPKSNKFEQSYGILDRESRLYINYVIKFSAASIPG